MRNGKVNLFNLLGFIIFCLMYFLFQNSAYLTMWFSERAKINVGVMTCIWNISPLFMAFMDFFIFNEKLKYYHIVGMAALILSCFSISVSSGQYN